MSHHLDTPLAAQSGQLFIDDLYVFPAGTAVPSGLTTATAAGQRADQFPYVVPA